MRTRKDSVATGFGLAQDFRFNTRPVGREPRTAWGSEVEVSLPFNDSTQSTNSYDFSGFPALNSHKSSFSYKEKQRYEVAIYFFSDIFSNHHHQPYFSANLKFIFHTLTA